MTSRVYNIRTGRWENCTVGATCRLHMHSPKDLSTSEIQGIAASIELDRNEAQPTANLSHSQENKLSFLSRINRSRAQKKLLKKAQSIIGKTGYEINALGTFDNTKGDNTKNKGHLGNIVQENVFGLAPNSTAEPDFVNEQLELKVIGVRKNKNGNWVAKERMVANIIDFSSEDTSGDIRKSSFWKKNRMMIIVMYEAKHEDKLANKIIGAFILDLSKTEEFKQIEADYRVINSHIKNGTAHEISGKQTVLLEACTKGLGKGRDLRSQPNSTIPAKQRAYALKTKFMNPIVNTILSK